MFYSINWIILSIFICLIHETKQYNLFDDNEEKSSLHFIFKRQACGSTHFQCKSGQCIEKYLLCDGNENCEDASDETKNQCSQIRCPSYTFQCNYGACIDKLGECNGVKDCADNSDENSIKCPKKQIFKCRDFQFECHSGECIEGFDKCDGRRNCADGSDESTEACGHQQCSSLYFRCSYGACIDSALKCNGENDCADGSDEDVKICGRSVTTHRTTTTRTTSIPAGDGCGIPELPSGGYYSLLGSNIRPYPGEIVRPGTVLQYKCSNNYVLTPSPFAVCNNGQFNPIPKCETTCPTRESTSVDLKCTYYGRIVDCSDRTSLLNGTVMTMKCKDYFHPKYENQIQKTQCIDGTWGAGIMNCEPECGVVGSAQPLIIGGIKTQINEHPWHVGIYKYFILNDTYEYICGGNIIHPKFILSVAHCFTDQATGDIILEYNKGLVDFVIAAGKLYREYGDSRDDRTVQKRRIKKINIPPQYKAFILHYSHDIAVLELDQELPRNSVIQSVCLDFDFNYSLNDKGTVVGWGLTETTGRKGDPQLRKLHVPVINKEECFQIVPRDYQPFLIEDHICAGLINGSSVCQGDSGGGLVFRRNHDKRYTVIGLVSNGPIKNNFCDYNQVAAYTDVKKYKDFIQKYFQ